MKKIPYSRQYVNFKDKNEVNKVLDEDFITVGSRVKEFETKISRFVGVKKTIVVNSATSALHIACLALDLKRDDIAWCSANSFLSSATSIKMCGAHVDFIDISMNDFNISVDELEKKLRLTNKKKLPKLIILTHLGGVPCDLKKINKLSKKYKFKIIEDASHALGSKYFDTRIGSCKYSDITVFSFHPVKTITTGEGGCCTTNSEKLSKKITLLRSHGINRDIKKKNKPPFFYDQNILGYNYRLSDINCALGISQLRRVEKIVNKRNTVAKYYRKNLISKKFTFQIIEKKNVSSQHLFIIRLIDRKLIKKQLNIIQDLLKLNITVSIHYYPIYLLKFFKKMGFNQGYCKNAEDYYKSSFSIPNFEMITRKQQDYVISNFKKVILKYS